MAGEAILVHGSRACTCVWQPGSRLASRPGGQGSSRKLGWQHLTTHPPLGGPTKLPGSSRRRRLARLRAPPHPLPAWSSWAKHREPVRSPPDLRGGTILRLVELSQQARRGDVGGVVAVGHRDNRRVGVGACRVAVGNVRPVDRPVDQVNHHSRV
eukprot:1178780-Prorocentrum_minimum.AAC.5